MATDKSTFLQSRRPCILSPAAQKSRRELPFPLWSGKLKNGIKGAETAHENCCDHEEIDHCRFTEVELPDVAINITGALVL